MTMPKPCYDCVDIHGDNPTEWLNKWPQGAEYRSDYQEHLCDGCYDERVDNDNVEWNDFDDVPYYG